MLQSPMEEIGIVTKTEGVMATVLVERKNACGQCTSGTCMVSEDSAEILAINAAKALVGQKVRVSLKPFTYLKSAALVYGVPVVALFVGAIAGKVFLKGYFPAQDPEILSALGGFAALLVSLIIVKAVSFNLEQKSEYKPVVDEILEDRQNRRA